MGFLKKIIRKFINKNIDTEPWLAYYSKEDRQIKFTNKRIYDYLKDNVSKYPDYKALNYFGNHITYEQLLNDIESASKSLKALGVKKGDVVTICMPNMPEAIIMFYASNNIGAVADMVHPLSSADELKEYLEQSKSRILLLVDFDYDKFKEVIDESLVYKTIYSSPGDSMPPVMRLGYRFTRGYKTKKPSLSNPDYMKWSDFQFLSHGYKKPIINTMTSKDVALILHSGGTTGTPKGIMISNYAFNAEAQQDGVNVYNVRPKDKIMTILPIFHGFGLGVCLHCPLSLRVEVILVPEFEAKRFHRMMKNDKPNIIAGVPTLWEAMMDNKNFDDVDLSPLKYVISGGDYLTIPMEQRMNNFLRTHGASISITKGYGMTESVAATAFTFDGTNEPGSIGIPMVGNNFCICEPYTTTPLEFGLEGEICVNGPTIMEGYLNKPEETANVLKKHEDGKTWLHTGDIGYISPEGIIYFTQRLKRMIVSSGFNIYPSTIEEALCTHPDVDKCCVIGVPHPYKMHVPKAFVVLKDGKKPTPKIKKELIALSKEKLAGYSQVKIFEFRDKLPQTLYKKIDAKALEAEEAAKAKKESSKQNGKEKTTKE